MSEKFSSPLQGTIPDRLWTPDRQRIRRSASSLAEALTGINQDSGPRIMVSGRPDNEDSQTIVYAITNPQKLANSRRLLRVGAHDDDVVLGLVNPGFATVTATLTDGSQRDVGRYDAQWRRVERIEESMVAEANLEREHGMGSLYINYGLPDGKLGEEPHLTNAIDSLIDLMIVVKPDLVLAPHPDDKHPDHRAANEAARVAAKVVGDLPFYAYDTPTMLDQHGEPVRYTHVYVMTPTDVQRRTEFYGTFGSQVNWPADRLPDLADVRMVYELPNLRGRQWKNFGVDHAGVLLHQDGGDLITAEYPELIVAKGEDLYLHAA